MDTTVLIFTLTQLLNYYCYIIHTNRSVPKVSFMLLHYLHAVDLIVVSMVTREATVPPPFRNLPVMDIIRQALVPWLTLTARRFLPRHYRSSYETWGQSENKVLVFSLTDFQLISGFRPQLSYFRHEKDKLRRQTQTSTNLIGADKAVTVSQVLMAYSEALNAAKVHHDVSIHLLQLQPQTTTPSHHSGHFLLSVH